jgi:ParB family chromosome partitioning protein
MSKTTATLLATQRDLVQMPNVFSRAALNRSGMTMARPVIGEQYAEVRLEAIVQESPIQTRRSFDPEYDEDDQALVESLRSEPQREPVQLKELEGTCPPQYAVLDGHRRVAALRHLGRETVKAIIKREGTLDCDLTTLTAHVRKNLSPMELAQAIQRLRERHKLTYEAISRRVGLKIRYLKDLQAMLGAEPEVLAEVEAGRISAYVARRITTQPGETQAALAAIASANRLSGTQTENLIRRLQVTGEEPELAARALGLTTAAPAPMDGSEQTRTPTQSDELDLADVERPEAAAESPENDAMTRAIERYQALLAATLPELADERVQAIARLCARQSLRHSVLKVAGLIALVNGDITSEQAVGTAGSITKAPGVREILQIVDACAHLRIILRAGKMGQGIESTMSGLHQIVSQLVAEVNAQRSQTP